MRIAAITTVRHNVGDDFVREGIFHLLKQVFPSAQVVSVHKHLPITARPEWDWVYSSGFCRLLDYIPGLSGLGVTRRLDCRLPVNRRTDRILNSDLLVQCGAPVYWLHGMNSCAYNEWYEPLIRRRWSQVRGRVPLLNLGGGSCQAYQSDGSEFAGASETLAYIREFCDSCRVTVLRDPLAGKILEMAGRTAPVLPCPSIFARFAVSLVPQTPQYVVLNYMPTGGHYVYGKGTGVDAWEEAFRAFVRGLPRNEEYRFVCHNQAELAAARRLFPEIPAFWSSDYRDYLKFFAGAKFGILNRVHAAFAMASFGRPSFVVGNDSRARMSEMIGLKNGFVGDVTTARLEEEFERLHSSWIHFAAGMDRLQSDTEQAYLKVLRDALPDHIALNHE